MKSNENDHEYDVVDREILKNLLKEDCIDWYYFHEKYRLSPGQFSRSMKKLETFGYLVIIDEKIKITEKGRKYLIAERNNILRKNSPEHWELPQSERLSSKTDINQFYLPNIKKMRGKFGAS